MVSNCFLIQIAEFTKEASEKWKALRPDEKTEYEASAAEDKKRYEREVCFFFNRTPVHDRYFA